MDAIIIEDFESMISSEEWEVAVFNLINACFLSKTKIYISSKTVSKDLEIDLVDLMSRLSSFTGVEVPEISEEEKIELENITKNITNSLTILLDKKLELFSSTINNK